MPRNQVRDPVHNDIALYLAGAVAGVVFIAVSVMWASLKIGTSQQVPGNPFTAVGQLAAGTLSWSVGASLVAGAFAILIVGLSVGAGVLWAKRTGGRTRVDAAAKHMGALRDAASLTAEKCWDKARQLGVDLTTVTVPGISLGRHLRSGAAIFCDWESLIALIAGPRSGKTTSMIVPAILDAPGAVVTTSNKRDVVDDTRAVLQARGKTCWVFDPQQVATETPSWWWNPLSAVTSDVKAAELAAHFAASGENADGARKDAFFEPAGIELLTGLILAAAEAARPISQVYAWVSRDDNTEPVTILRARWPLFAEGLQAHYQSPDKQRSGVFATAKKMCECLKYAHMQPWIDRIGPTDNRPQFDPAAFVTSGDVLYSLSKEGAGSAGALVTALTAAVVEAASEHAKTLPRGRLAVPMVCALDEIANVVRWAELPNLYSYYGSRGIIIAAILQSYAQGEEVWGARGMAKLWGAANVKIYLGGGTVSSDGFLQALSTTIGDHSEISGSVSVSGSSRDRSVSRHRTDRRTLTEAELAAMPRGRSIIVSSGNLPIIARTVPWWETAHAEEIKRAQQSAVTVTEPELRPPHITVGRTAEL